MTTLAREPIRFLVFSASMRTGSLNSKLAELAAETIVANDGAVDLASMEEFDSPSFDADDESAVGLPAGAQNFKERLEASDGFVISSPEYNGSMPGTLKNVIDWVSRARPQPFNEHHGLCPHPHIGLSTVTWLFDGEALHGDSLGTEQVIRPGQLGR